MPAEKEPIRPTVEWAQRKDVLFVTIKAEDCKKPVYQFSDDTLHVSGTVGPEQRQFDLSMPFYKEIDTEKSRCIPSDRCVQFIIPKKASGPFWPRLLKSEKKEHWVKVDFEKWKDEDDESDEDGMNWDLNDMMGKMGGYGDAKPDMDDMGDSDEEELPDLEDDKEEEGENENGKQADTEQTPGK